MRSLPRCTTVGCSEKSILLFSPYFTTLSVVVRVCIRKPVNKGFSADFAKWNISDASVGTEELAHVELICTMVYQLTSDASPEELKAAGLGSNYAQNGYGIYPTDSNGVPFDVRPIAVMSNPVTDLHEDMAAEQKALATYYQLINLTDDVDVIDVLKFLGQREIIHYQRFGEALMDAYELEESQKMF
ncbi:manganese catalase family protein [Clostridioides difficile]|nr:manganese catalase family protein [Clostridioides difficile]